MAQALTRAQKDRKNELRRLKYATDPEYRAKHDASVKAWKDKQKTGFGRGRPRIGEVRPVSKLATYANNYRENNDDWKEYNRIKQAEWATNNPERVKEIKRDSLARAIQRKQEQ